MGVGCASRLLANIPVAAASVLMVKGYFVTADLVPERALGTLLTDWPRSTLPRIRGYDVRGPLGGDATLIGAAANVVSAGICATHRTLAFGVLTDLFALLARWKAYQPTSLALGGPRA